MTNYIRITHRHGFRSGEWAAIVCEGLWQTHDGWKYVYIVKFPDGKLDAWPILDELAGYEYKEDPESTMCRSLTEVFNKE